MAMHTHCSDQQRRISFVRHHAFEEKFKETFTLNAVFWFVVNSRIKLKSKLMLIESPLRLDIELHI